MVFKRTSFHGQRETYKVKLHDLGKEFFVWAFYKDGSETKGAISKLKGPVTRPTNKPGFVRYKGKSKGKTIRAVVRDGTSLNRDNISYQWQWTNNKTNGWKDFAGQTNATFKLRGKWVRNMCELRSLTPIIMATLRPGVGPKVDKTDINNRRDRSD